MAALVMGLSDMAHGALGFALADQVDPATSYDIHMAYFETPAILGLNTGPMLLTLGMLLLGFGVLRSRALPRWVGTGIMLSPIAVYASFAFGLPTFTQALAFATGIGAFAYATLNGPVLFAQRRGVAEG